MISRLQTAKSRLEVVAGVLMAIGFVLWVIATGACLVLLLWLIFRESVWLGLAALIALPVLVWFNETFDP